MSRLILLVGLCAALLMPSQPVLATADEYMPAEIVIQLVSSADLNPVATSYGLDPQPIDQFGSRPIFRLRIADGQLPPDKAVTLLADSRVRFAEPNYIAASPESRGRSSWSIGSGDPGYADQSAPAVIRLAAAHQISTGAGVIVAVLDTGVDRAHPALVGSLLPGFDFVDFDADPTEMGNDGDDGYGHGTHVAGIVRLVAPAAQILPVRVLDQAGEGNIWVLAEGIAYALDPDGNPATRDEAQVINLSLGTLRPTQLIDQLVKEATCVGYIPDEDDDDDDPADLRCAAGGTVVVSAAGNSGDTTPHYPAAERVDGALAVAAATSAGTLAPFATRGDWVDLAAPGLGVVSSLPGERYAAWSGSSMAAPFAAGVAALVRAQQPALSAAEVAVRVQSGPLLCQAAYPRLDAAQAVGLPAVLPICGMATLPIIRIA